MKFLLAFTSLAALSGAAAALTADGEDKKLPGLRLVSTKRIPINNKEIQRSLMTDEEYKIWDNLQSNTNNRRQKKYGANAVGDKSISGSSNHKGKGISSSSSSKGSKGSKGGNSSDNGHVEECHGDHCDEEEKCYECAPACEVVVYEFVGQTGHLIGDESANPIFNSVFNQYVQDDNVYQPDGQLDSALQNPAVYNTAKCTQVRLGKQCEGQENTPPEDRVCCEGLTMCDFQYSLRYVVLCFLCD
jgi:hypothetical protein